MLCEKSEVKDLYTKLVSNFESSNLGPVGQMIVSLTTSLDVNSLSICGPHMQYTIILLEKC